MMKARKLILMGWILGLAAFSVMCAQEGVAVRRSAPLTPPVAVKAMDVSLEDILGKMPPDTIPAGNEIAASLIAIGPEGLGQLCDQIVPPGTGDDTKARWAVTILNKFAISYAAESDRLMVAQAMIAALDKAEDDEVKAFLIRQLQVVGREEAVLALAPYLTNERLNEPAVQALLAIGGPEANSALLAGLQTAPEARAVTMTQAMGRNKITGAVQTLKERAGAKDREIRLAALWSLGQIGAKGCDDLFAKGVKTKSLYEQNRIYGYWVDYARNLTANGDDKAAAAVIDDLMDADRPVHVRTAALSLLGADCPQDAVSPDPTGKRTRAIEALTEALKDDSKAHRCAALKFILSLNAAQALVEELAEAKPEVQAEILEALADSEQTDLYSATAPYLQSEDQAVRLAAVEAAATLGGQGAAEDLVTLLSQGTAEDRQAVKGAFLRIDLRDVEPMPEEVYNELPAEARVVCFEVVGERRLKQMLPICLMGAKDENAAVRTAAFAAMATVAGPENTGAMVEMLTGAPSDREVRALQGSLAAVLGRSDDATLAEVILAFNKLNDTGKSRLMDVLRRNGKPAGAQAIWAVYRNSKNEDLKTDAIRALSSWPEPSPIMVAGLTNVAAQDSQKTRHVLAHRGAVAMLSHDAVGDDDRLKLTPALYAAATSDEEKQAALEVLKKVNDQTAAEAARQAITAPKPTPTPEAPKVNYPPPEATPDADGFRSLFNGKDLTGWIGNTTGYVAENGMIAVKPKLGGGNLYTDKQYSDFHMKFEFMLTPGANNGLGIRTPVAGDSAYVGMELQILDNESPKYAKLDPRQYHGSVYGVAAAKRGFQKPAGEWNAQEVIALGPQITVILNGETIVDCNLEEAKAKGEFMNNSAHPGLDNSIGHIGFLGHGDELFFRNLKIKELDRGDNTPPMAFEALFNGQDLTGWKGLLAGPNDNPIQRAALSAEARAEAQKEADENMRAHWSVQDGALEFDGKGRSLVTARDDYGDFEIWVDWKIKEKGDSGLYLRGAPQVQIWDPAQRPVGSGGLFNNQKNPSSPSRCADNPIGDWNTFFIKMVGERVTVVLNGWLVVDNVIMENYWDRSQPIFPTGPIELQNHGNNLYFKNIYLRELPRQ